MIEDTEYTEEDIEQLFGPKVAQIVVGPVSYTHLDVYKRQPPTIAGSPSQT